MSAASVQGRASAVPEPPSETLVSTDDLLALRLNGRPRDPATGAHRAVVIFVRPDLAPRRLAQHLRDAADRLETRLSVSAGYSSG